MEQGGLYEYLRFEQKNFGANHHYVDFGGEEVTIKLSKLDSTTQLRVAFNLTDHAVSGDLPAVQRAIALEGASPNDERQFKLCRSPVHGAASNGHAEVVRALCEADADVQWADANGTTCLMSACRNGHELSAGVLLQHGAKADAVDSQGITTLMHTVDGAFDMVLHYTVGRNPRQKDYIRCSSSRTASPHTLPSISMCNSASEPRWRRSH